MATASELPNSTTPHAGRIHELLHIIADAGRELAELTGTEFKGVEFGGNALNHSGELKLPPEISALVGRNGDHFQAAFAGAPDALLMLDDNGVIVEANNAAGRLFDLPCNALIGQSAAAYATSKTDFDQTWSDFLDGKISRGELTIVRRDGSRRSAEFVAVKEFAPGLHLSSLRDVTETRQAARHLHRRNRDLTRLNEQLLVLQQISLRLSGALRLHDVYWVMYREIAQRFLHSPHLTIAHFDDERKTFFCDFAIIDSAERDPADFPPMPLGSGPMSETVRLGRAHIVDLERTREQLPPERQRLVGDERVPLSGLYAPLISNERVIGVLNVQSYERNAYDEIDQTLLAILANQAAAALVNARLYEQAQQEVAERARAEVALQDALEMLRERVKELTVLTQVSGLLHERSVDSEVLWQTVVNMLPDAFQSPELASAAIRIGDREWKSPNFAESEWRLQTEFDVPDGRSASIEISYRSRPKLHAEDVFLAEERDFLRTLSEMFRIYFERHHAEAASRYNEMLLSRVLETLPVGVWISDQGRNTLRTNPAALSIWGLERPFETQSTGYMRGWWSSTGRPVLPDEWASERARRTGNAILDDEIEIETYDGKRKVISNSAVPIRDDAGQVIGQIIVNQDITDRKRRERQLAAIAVVADAVRMVETHAQIVPVALDRIDSLVNATGTAMITYSEQNQSMQIEYATGEFAPLTGAWITSETSVCHTVMAKGQPVVIQDAHSYREELWKPHIRETEAAVCVPLRAQGEVTGVLVVGQNHRIDPDGVYLVSALADIVAGAAHRAALYAQVQSQAQRLARVMETAPSGIFVLDKELRVVLQNERALRYLELMKSVSSDNRVSHLAGNPIGEFLTRRDADAPMQEIEIDIPEHRIFEVDVEPVAGDGDSSEIERAETEWVILLRDVTREREIQQRIQQHDRLVAIGQLAAGIAHDFNNIAAVIVLYSQILQRSKNLTEGEQKRITVIREQAQHASYLIRQILDFSRQSVLERRPLDLADFVENVSVLLSHTLPESIHISHEIVDSGEFIVAADATRLQQVVMNLAVNGRDAMPHGGFLTIRLGRVRVRPGVTPLPEMQPGLWFWLSVEDTGTGILPEHLARVFDPFFSTKGPGKGTGLGLAQVYGIVRQHDGYVGVSSQVGQGTTVTVYLPAWHEASASVEEDDTSMLIEPHGRGEIILLVEDSAPARDATRAILEMQGYRVLVAANGEDGLKLYRKYGSAIDLVLSDLVMPVMGGIELYRTLQAEHAGLRFIIMTGYPLEDGGKELLEQGIVAWIQKPFSIAELTRKVNSVLRRS